MWPLPFSRTTVNLVLLGLLFAGVTAGLVYVYRLGVTNERARAAVQRIADVPAALGRVADARVRDRDGVGERVRRDPVPWFVAGIIAGLLIAQFLS